MANCKREYLAEVERDFGKDCRYAQMLREQIAEEKGGGQPEHEVHCIGSRARKLAPRKY